MVQHLLLTLVAAAAARARRRRSPCSSGRPARDPPPADPAGPPLAAGPGRDVPGRHLARCSPRRCGGPTSRRSSTRRSRTRPSTSSSTPSTSSPRCCSGGRSSALDPSPVADARARPGSCTCSSRCPRTRSSARDRQRDGPALRPLRDARPGLGPGGRSRTSSWPAGSCGSSATSSSSTAILGIVVGWMRREERESHAADARRGGGAGGDPRTGDSPRRAARPRARRDLTRDRGRRSGEDQAGEPASSAR